MPKNLTTWFMDDPKDELFQLTAQLACAQEEIHFLESLLGRAKTNEQVDSTTTGIFHK